MIDPTKLLPKTFHPPSSAAILALVVFAACAAAPPVAVAQDRPDMASDLVFDPPSPSTKPSPDGEIESALDRFSRWKARMKTDHFSEYLAAYTALLGAVTGLFFGMMAYRMSDPMSPYRLVRRRALQLTAAIGFSLGIIVAVTQVPPDATGKVSLLVLAAAVGAATAFLGAAVAFLIMRLLANRAARRSGRRVGDRIRHA